MTLPAFLQMGRFTVFIWAAYGFAGLMVFLNVVQPLIQKRRLWERLRRNQDDDEEDMYEETE
ncbi:heme exporter protein CcmD [Acidiferrobacter sp.]|jgi:heme exporter protein CcmD|uniref:heme exporter protein CcmD n=1 Tax=Acidiferrobacter sp. TaxID=1872107 RepID=UPI002615B3BA|nr:heme exporter protein CcmD [Acidiferrobacter sp.]